MIKSMMKLIEECAGVGELMSEEESLRQVRYRLSRFQGMREGGDLPIPGLHRIEGTVEFDSPASVDGWIGTPLRLKIEDGRVFGITLMDAAGRILSVGHGPSKCLCC
jgi:hypothetical protein